MTPGSTSIVVAVPVLEHLDEGHEEVGDTVAQLLHVGVLVGRPLVAVDRDPLVHHAAVQVSLLPERLHDQLLQVAREEQKAVLVGKDHHVLRSASAARVVPGQREERRRVRRTSRARVRPSIAAAPSSIPFMSIPWRVAGKSPTADISEVRPPTQSHIGNRSRKPCSTAKRSSLLPSSVTATAWGPSFRPAAVGRGRLEHAVSRLGRAAGLRDHDRERRPQAGTQPPQHAVDPVRIGVVEEMRPEPVRLASERVRDELGPEGRAPDPDREEIGESLGLVRPDLPLVHGIGEGEDPGQGLPDRAGDLGGRGEIGVAEPVVPHHAVLVGVGDRAALERRHRVERGRERARESSVRVVWEVHPADVEPEPRRRVVVQPSPVAIPERACVHGGRPQRVSIPSAIFTSNFCVTLFEPSVSVASYVPDRTKS